MFVACGDIEEAQLVRSGRIVGGSGLHGIARILEIDEVDALDDAPILNVEAGNDADLEHGQVLRWAGVGRNKKDRHGRRGRGRCLPWGHIVAAQLGGGMVGELDERRCREQNPPMRRLFGCG